jgi:hypothetical protein
VELRSIGDWNIVRKSGNLQLPASIQQIESSPMGDFIVIRCVHTLYNKEYRNVPQLVYIPDLIYKTLATSDICLYSSEEQPCCHGNQLHYILVYFYYVGYVTNKGLPIQLEVFLAA